LSTGRATELIDPSLHVEPGRSKILQCIHVALLGAQDNRADMPTMSDVLMMLKSDITWPLPRRPEDPWRPSVSPADRTDLTIQVQGGRVKN
jgi:interleukin-1 receptor-associated kinase 1